MQQEEAEQHQTAEINFMLTRIQKHQKLQFKQIDDCVITCLNHKRLAKDHVSQVLSQP